MQAPAQQKQSKWKVFFRKKEKSIAPRQQTQIDKTTDSIIQKETKQQLPQVQQAKQQTTEIKATMQNNQKDREELIKQSHSQTTNDSKPEQRINNEKESSKKEVFSLQTNKLISILQSKNIKKQTVSQKKESEKLFPTKQTEFHQQPKHDRTKTKSKTGHYKIFNPEHFEVKDEQIKTSIHRWTYGSGQTSNKLLIHSWNINGIRARMANNQILPYLEFHKPDILCVNETKLDEKSYLENPYKFWGYYSYWNFPKYSLGYSGVAIFSKYPAIQMFEDIHLPEHSKEGRVITLEFDKFVLINIYVPTIGRELQRLDYRVKQYDPAFHEWVLKTKEKFPQKTIIVCGDLNVAHDFLDCHTGKRMKEGKQPAFTINERVSFSTLLKKANLVDTFRYFHPNQREYTWWNMRRGGRKRNGQTGIGKRLDYFLVDEPSMKYVKGSEIKKEVEGCDHCPIELRIEFE